MDEIRSKLLELLDKLNFIEGQEEYQTEILFDVKAKLRLFISKFFSERYELEELISELFEDPTNRTEYENTIFKLKSIITTLIEDLDLDSKNLSIQTEEEKQQILAQVRKEAELEKERLKNESSEIQKIKEQLLNDRKRLIEEEEKYKLFKQKLEVSKDKFDFFTESKKNGRISIFWGISVCTLIFVLFWLLNGHFTEDNAFPNIALSIKERLSKEFGSNQNLIDKTIYIAYAKYIVTKLLFYSILIYSIVFCIKNYNAQMHNKIVNLHKANAFQSIISLLDTAKSDEGNDKLLVQATQAIFSHQNTGYNGIDVEPNNPNLVTNIIDSVSKKV